MKKFFLFVAGALIAATTILAPIHELGHIIGANIVGGHAEFAGWAQAYVYGVHVKADRVFVAWSGVGFEVLFYLGLYLITRRRRPGVAAFSIGSVISSYVLAGTLTDIRDIGSIGLTGWYIIMGLLIAMTIIPKRAGIEVEKGSFAKAWANQVKESGAYRSPLGPM